MRHIASFFRVGDDNPLNGWHVLGIVVLFFGTIIAVNIVMAAYATGTFPGLVVRNGYVASQHFNKMLADSREQASRGWTSELSADNGALRVRIAGPGGAPINGLSVAARVGRPASASQDRIFDLRPTADGYLADESLAPGGWIVEVEAHSGDKIVYRITDTLHVTGGGS